MVVRGRDLYERCELGGTNTRTVSPPLLSGQVDRGAAGQLLATMSDMPVRWHAGDEFGSTRGGGSGILVDVHSVLRDETNGSANH